MGRAHPQSAGGADPGQSAIWQATSGRPRPVALECALDTWAKRSEVVIPDAPLALPPETIDDEAVETAAKILGQAERPIIVLGGGAMDASDEIIKLAEDARGAGEFLSPRARNRPRLASVGGRHADRPPPVEGGRRRAGGRHALLHPERQLGHRRPAKVVRVDIDPDEPERFRKPDAALVGDAAPQLRALIAALARTIASAARAPRS